MQSKSRVKRDQRPSPRGCDWRLKKHGESGDWGRSPKGDSEKRNAWAETLWPDVGSQTRKPGSGGAAGLTDVKEYTQNLFRLKMVRPGTETGAGGGGPRDMVAVVGKAVAGAMAGEQLVKDPSSTTAWYKTSAENKNTRLDRGQDNGELVDMSPQYGMLALGYSVGFTIPIHTPLQLVLGIIICNSDNKLLKKVPNTRYFITLY